MPSKTIRIATRKSPLALWQASFIQKRLLQFYPNYNIQLYPLSTEGDEKLDQSLAKIGGKGLFIKRLEEALLRGEADIAVHSAKDLPATLEPFFCIAGFTKREDPRDVLVSKKPIKKLTDLPYTAKIGTSSLRRQSQLLAKNPHYDCISIRGNLASRLKLLESQSFDAIVLAAAGLHRLNMRHLPLYYLSIDECLPAIGQGIIAVECLQERKDLRKILTCCQNIESLLCITAERSMNTLLNGNCQCPIAGYARLIGTTLTLSGYVASADGKTQLYVSESGNYSEAATLGIAVGNALIAKGARALLMQKTESII